VNIDIHIYYVFLDIPMAIGPIRVWISDFFPFSISLFVVFSLRLFVHS